jgi:hypothetical protein
MEELTKKESDYLLPMGISGLGGIVALLSLR